MRATPTVRELAKSYIDGHAKLKKKTWKIDEAYLNQLLIPRFGAHLASSITRADIASIHTDIGKKQPYTANRFISIIRKMYNVGRHLGMVPEEVRNPGTEIVPFAEKKRRRYVTLAEMPLLAAAIDEDPNEFAGHALWLLLLTGVRRSEILAARWSDVDWDNGTLYIGAMTNDSDDEGDEKMAESGKVAKITRAVLQVASGAIPFAGGALSAIAGACARAFDSTGPAGKL